uniref:Uncharacterized protein n=1 Tax=Arundo donax TaxID=35708 RepID=A0A0A9BPZ7_ARUDO
MNPVLAFTSKLDFLLLQNHSANRDCHFLLFL